MPEHPLRIGVVITTLEGIDTTALKYLILYQNTLQKSFQFELLPVDERDKFLSALDSRAPVKRESIEKQMDAFLVRYKKWLENYASSFDLTPSLPDTYVILSTARFSDNYYVTGNDDLDIVALGNWKRNM